MSNGYTPVVPGGSGPVGRDPEKPGLVKPSHAGAGVTKIRLMATMLFILVANPFAGVQVFADQSDPDLPQLFSELKKAPDGTSAAEIESRIWQMWLQAPDSDSDELLRAVASAMQQSDYREAVIISTRLVEDYPDYAEGWNKRATVYYLQGNFDSSVSDIYETLKREPRHFGAISGLGLIFQRRGDLEGALAAFEQVLAISPQSRNAQINVEQLKQELANDI